MVGNVTAERLVVGAVTVLSALNSCSYRHRRLALVYFSAFYNSQPDDIVTSQIRVQTKHELFEQMHF
jgi:hypothetical protein